MICQRNSKGGPSGSSVRSECRTPRCCYAMQRIALFPHQPSFASPHETVCGASR
jgi:hypothetical protein